MAKIAKIFVIVVTYKGHQWYNRCLTSLRNSEYPVQTIVIDNASNDGTIEYIREHFPEMHLIDSKENLGFGQANNIGMRYALDNGCDYVFLLNQDAWIDSNTLGDLLSVHNKHSEYGILSPLHLTAEKNNVENGLATYLNDYRTTDINFFQDLYFNRVKEVYESKYINAAGWLLPRKTIETIGGFDPIFFHYEEDDDYLNRAHYHKIKVGIVPKVHMVHDHHHTFEISNEKSTLRRHQFLLVRLTNVNNNESFSKYSVYLLRKIIVCFLCGKWNKMKVWWTDLCFLLVRKKRILQSRELNIQKGTTWL